MLRKLNETKEEVLQIIEQEVKRVISAKMYDVKHFVKKDELGEHIDTQVSTMLSKYAHANDLHKLSDRIDILSKEHSKSADHYHRLINDVDDSLQRKLNLMFETQWDHKFVKVSQVFRKVKKVTDDLTARVVAMEDKDNKFNPLTYKLGISSQIAELDSKIQNIDEESKLNSKKLGNLKTILGGLQDIVSSNNDNLDTKVSELTKKINRIQSESNPFIENKAKSLHVRSQSESKPAIKSSSKISKSSKKVTIETENNKQISSTTKKR